MQRIVTTWMIGAVLVAGCGGSKATGGADMTTVADMAGAPAVMGEHGRLIDYFSNKALAGLTVTDGSNSVTTAADGTFVLPAAIGAALAPFAGGTGYATLYLPEATAVGADVDRGDVPMATTSAFAYEQQILANNTSQALVHILVVKSGACANVGGGTITVNAPAGAKLAYFTSGGLPVSPTMVDIVAPHPVAVVYDVTPGAAIDLTFNVPGCTPAPVESWNGMTLNGQVQTMATEPGDNAASLIFVLQ